jgi:hypothetical protein
MSFTVKKTGGKLIFKDRGCYETRNASTIWCIEQANAVYNWKDFDEITIHTQDWGHANEYTYSKFDQYDGLVPEWNFHAWPQIGVDDYAATTLQMSEAGKEPYEINKVGWIGETGLPIRSKMLEIARRNTDVLDVISMSWIRQHNKVKLDSTTYLSFPQLAKRYSVLIDVEGGGFSARLKYLLWSRRPVIIVDRPYKEFFFKHLKEWEHYVPVKRDLSDLVEKAKWCIDHYDEALQIAERAYQFSQVHLTREAAYKQWDRIITNEDSSVHDGTSTE